MGQQLVTNGFFDSSGNRFIAATSDQVLVYSTYDPHRW
jgi:WD40 repeat protein